MNNQEKEYNGEYLTGQLVEVGGITVKCIASNIRRLEKDWNFSLEAIQSIGKEGDLVVVEALSDFGSTTHVENQTGRDERIYRGDKFGPKRLSLVHGDFHSGNMGFELGKPIEEGFVQFDLRGVDLGTRMDIVYDLGKLAFSFLFNLVDRAHALIAPISSLQMEEKTGEASVRLEYDMLQEKRIHSHLEIRRQIWAFLKHHQTLVDVLKKMGEESETWLTRTVLAEAVNLIGVAPDRLKDDPSGSLSLTYYVLTTKLLNDFLRSAGIGIQTGYLSASDGELL